MRTVARRCTSLLALLLAACGIGSATDDIGDDLARAIGPSSVDSALLLTKTPIRDTFRALYALPIALEDPEAGIALGVEVGPPNGDGERAWRSEYKRFSHDEDPIVLEGSAQPVEPGTWAVEFQRLDESIACSFEAHRVSENRVDWTGQGVYDGPASGSTRFWSGPASPFHLLSPPVSPGVVGPYEFSGCLTIRTAYLGDVLQGRLCHDGDGRFDEVVRNGVPDPGGVRGDR